MGRPFQRGPYDALPEHPRRPHRYFETEANNIEVESGPFGRMKAHYRRFGEGPPLLLVHGLMTSSYSWRYVLDQLGAHFTLYIPDLPGAGRSDKPDCEYSAPALARWIVDFQRAVDIYGCAVIGNSMGGYLSMRAALADPPSMKCLINIHSPGLPEARLSALHAALAIPGLAAGLAWWVRGRPMKWAHANVHYFDESLKSLEEAKEYGAPLSTVEGARAFVHYLSDTLAPVELSRFVEQLEALRTADKPFVVPLQLIYARTDPMVPPEIGERLAALVPKAQMIWLENTSHFAHVDTPELILEPVLEFLGISRLG